VPGLEEYLHTQHSLLLNRTLVPRAFCGFFKFSEGLTFSPSHQACSCSMLCKSLVMMLQGGLYTRSSQISPPLSHQGKPQNGRAGGAVVCPPFFPHRSVRRTGHQGDQLPANSREPRWNEPVIWTFQSLLAGERRRLHSHLHLLCESLQLLVLRQKS